MNATPPLATPRLRLRPLDVADAEALFPILADDATMTWWSSAPHRSVDETRAMLGRDMHGWRGWTITLAGDDRGIGFVSAGVKRQAGVSEIGYLLSRDHWGRGFAGEAVAAVLDQLFRAEGLRRVFADTDPDNRGSCALLERLGFTLEGRLRGEWETHIGVRDSLIYGLLADEWRGPPPR